jgi:hypothetical protein
LSLVTVEQVRVTLTSPYVKSKLLLLRYVNELDRNCAVDLKIILVFPTILDLFTVIVVRELNSVVIELVSDFRE